MLFSLFPMGCFKFFMGLRIFCGFILFIFYFFSVSYLLSILSFSRDGVKSYSSFPFPRLFDDL